MSTPCRGTELSRIYDPSVMTAIGQRVTVPCPECGGPLTGVTVRNPNDAAGAPCLQITAHNNARLP